MGRNLNVVLFSVVAAVAAFKSCEAIAEKTAGETTLKNANSLEDGVTACYEKYGHAVADGTGAAARTMARHYIYASRKSFGERATDSAAVGLVEGAAEAGLMKGCLNAVNTKFGNGAAQPVTSADAGPANSGVPDEPVAVVRVAEATSPAASAAPAASTAPAASATHKCSMTTTSEGRLVKFCL